MTVANARLSARKLLPLGHSIASRPSCFFFFICTLCLYALVCSRANFSPWDTTLPLDPRVYHTHTHTHLHTYIHTYIYSDGHAAGGAQGAIEDVYITYLHHIISYNIFTSYHMHECVCLCVVVCVCARALVCVCIQTYSTLHTHTCTRTRTRTHTHTHTHTHIHTYIHTYMHTHTHLRDLSSPTSRRHFENKRAAP